MTVPISPNSSKCLIPKGSPDGKRLTALGSIYNPTSIQLLESSGIPKNPTILDVGCGHGGLTSLFAQIIGATVVGVDSSPAQLDIAKAAPEVQGLSNISWELCDVYHLSELQIKHPKLFDIVHTRFVLTHLSDLPSAVDQLLSMVKPGGLLIIEETGKKKAFKEPLCKPIQAWQKMVDRQYQLQKSHDDTIERVASHLDSLDHVTYKMVLSNIKIEGQQKKCMYRLGVEHWLKLELKSEENKTFDYKDEETWVKELENFELNDSEVIEVLNYESIVATKSNSQ